MSQGQAWNGADHSRPAPALRYSVGWKPNYIVVLHGFPQTGNRE
jgi:hypothetical protein